jgi:hypothetical protein
MMRSLVKRSIVTVAALVGVLGLSSAASAISIDLVWAGSGNSVTGTSFTGSEVVTLGVYAIITVPPGADGLQVSVSYDAAALSLVSCTNANKKVGQYVAGGYFQPALGKAAFCNTSVAGIVGQMDQQAALGYLPYLPGPGAIHVADIVFHVVGGSGNTVVQSFFDPIFDGWGSNAHVFSLNATFGSATVNIIPEPTTAILVGAGFLGLLAAGRRRRS